MNHPGIKLLRVELHIHENAFHQRDLVVVVIDDEIAIQAQVAPLDLAPQHPRADGVERAHRHIARRRADQLLQALFHLGGGLVGEGDGQDVPRQHPLLAHEPGDAVGNDPGFSTPRTGKDQQRAFGGGNGVTLGLV